MVMMCWEGLGGCYRPLPLAATAGVVNDAVMMMMDSLKPPLLLC